MSKRIQTSNRSPATPRRLRSTSPPRRDNAPWSSELLLSMALLATVAVLVGCQTDTPKFKVATHIDDADFGTHYNALWQEGPGNDLIGRFQDFDELLDAIDDYQEDGFQLIDVETLETPEVQEYLGVWRLLDPLHELVPDLDMAGFENQLTLSACRRLVDLEVRGSGTALRIDGIWRSEESCEGAPLELVHFDLDRGTFLEKVEDPDPESDEAYALIDLEINIVSGQPRYSGLWHRDSTPTLLELDLSCLGPENCAFAEKSTNLSPPGNQFSQSGLRLIDIETVQQAESSFLFSGIWRPGQGSDWLQLDVHWENILNRRHALKPDLGTILNPGGFPRKIIDLDLLAGAPVKERIRFQTFSGEDEARQAAANQILDYIHHDTQAKHSILHDDTTTGPPPP